MSVAANLGWRASGSADGPLLLCFAAEPTSALDSESSAAIERDLVAEVKSPDSKLKAIMWITHSPEQGQRVGTRFVRVESGGVREEQLEP